MVCSAIGAVLVVWYLTLGVSWGRGNIGMRCESLIKEKVRVWILGWLVCMSKVCL